MTTDLTPTETQASGLHRRMHVTLRWMVAPRQWESTRYTMADKYGNLCLLLVALAQYNEHNGKWATANDLAEITGFGLTKVNRALKDYRLLSDGGHDLLRYSKVGNKVKYCIEA